MRDPDRCGCRFHDGTLVGGACGYHSTREMEAYENGRRDGRSEGHVIVVEGAFVDATRSMLDSARTMSERWPRDFAYPQRLGYLPSWDEFVKDLEALAASVGVRE